MSNWSEVRSFLNQNYHVQSVDGPVVTVLVLAAPGRSQLVSVLPAGEILAVISIIGSFAQIDPVTLLQISSGRNLGVQASPRINEFYCVTTKIPLEGLSPEQLDYLIRAVGQEACAYQQQLGLQGT